MPDNYIVVVRYQSLARLFIWISEFVQWIFESPWEVLSYAVVAFFMYRLCRANRLCRMTCGMAWLLLKVAYQSACVQFRRVTRKLFVRESVFTGDPHQPVMRRPMIRPYAAGANGIGTRRPVSTASVPLPFLPVVPPAESTAAPTGETTGETESKKEE